LTGLETLSQLEEFWASWCQIGDFREVEEQLGDKEHLETVYFEGNPLEKRQPALYRNKVRLALPRVKQIDATFVRVE
jgi:protein phosphatase 1 regulatory subunit 7